MNLSQFLLILKARYKVMLITLLITVSTALILSRLIPPSYSSTASILLNYKGVDPVTGFSMPSQLMPGYMGTQKEIIESRNVTLKVIKSLKLQEMAERNRLFPKAKSPEQVQANLLDMLLDKLKVSPSKESSMLEISFSSADPEFSASVANAYAQSYIETGIELKVDPAKKASEYLAGQSTTLKKSFEDAQAKLAKYQQENGMTNIEQSLDVESLRLNELSAQLVAAQNATIDARSRNSNAKFNAYDSPDVANSATIQTLRMDISRAEGKLADMSKRLGDRHPDFQAAQAELDKLKSQLQSEVRHASGGVAGVYSISSQREAELRAQVANQKEKLLKLNLLRNNLAVLQKEVEDAKRAMDGVSQRFSASSLEGQSSQSDAVILNTAMPSYKPEGPGLVLIGLYSLLLGSLLGAGLAVASEFMDRRVRGKEDITTLVGVPVFAVVEIQSNRKSGGQLLGQYKKLLLSK